jgi:hypothetical protein
VTAASRRSQAWDGVMATEAIAALWAQRAQSRRAGQVAEAEVGEGMQTHHAHFRTPTSSVVHFASTVTSAPSSPSATQAAQAAEAEATTAKHLADAHEPSHVVHFDVRGRYMHERGCL